MSLLFLSSSCRNPFVVWLSIFSFLLLSSVVNHQATHQCPAGLNLDSCLCPDDDEEQSCLLVDVEADDPRLLLRLQQLWSILQWANRFMAKLMRKNDIPVHTGTDGDSDNNSGGSGRDDGMTSQSPFNWIGQSASQIISSSCSRRYWGQFAGCWFVKDRAASWASV